MSDEDKSNPPANAPAGERIAKVLARRGVASRRMAEVMIAEGRVAVNGKVIASPALNVTERDQITVDDQPLAEAQPTRLWLYHKPVGLVTTEKDEKGRPTVFAALPAELGRVMSIGRLDINSEGLLLLTNDGAVKRKLELPSTGWLRKYRVRVMGMPGEERLAPLRRGMTVEGERFQPMEVTFDRQQGANAWLTIGLREGKNREVRRALEAVGLSVNRLIRISYGPFRLGDLPPGQVEEVRRKVMRDQLGLGKDEAAAPEKPPRGAPQRSGAKPARPAGAKPAPKPFAKPAAKPAAKPGRRGAASTAAKLKGPAKPNPARPPGRSIDERRRGGRPAPPPGGKPTGGKPSGGKPRGGKPPRRPRGPTDKG